MTPLTREVARVFLPFTDDLKKSIRRVHGVTRDDESALPFDVTQEFDAALINELRQGSDPTLIETGLEKARRTIGAR